MESDGDRHHSYLLAAGRLLAQRDSTFNGAQNTPLASDAANSVLVAGSDPLTPVAYSPYGHRESAALLQGLPGFNGEQPDPLTGHYLLGNGYRAFNPVLMRFNSPDSLSPFRGGGLNPYAYCLGDPINSIDPTGHFPWLARMVSGLAWAGTSLGEASMRLTTAVARPLAKLAGNFKGSSTGLGNFEIIQHHRPAMVKIFDHLGPADIEILRATSKDMKALVDGLLLPTEKLLKGVRRAEDLIGNDALIRKAQSIASGREPLTTPAQLKRAGINARDIPQLSDSKNIPTMEGLKLGTDSFNAFIAIQVDVLRRLPQPRRWYFV
jgi:RHS repeat-associated protein